MVYKNFSLYLSTFIVQSQEITLRKKRNTIVKLPKTPFVDVNRYSIFVIFYWILRKINKMSAQNVNVCDITEDVKETLKKFRFAKHSSTAALILKVLCIFYRNSGTIFLYLLHGNDHLDCTLRFKYVTR